MSLQTRIPGRLARSRRTLALGALLAALAAAGIAAYAQFSSGGGGTAAPGAGALTISSPPVGPLSPQLNPADSTPVTVTVTVGGTSPLSVGRLSGSVRPSAGCESSWFTVAPVIAPGSLTPGTHTFASSVILNDDDRNQTACTTHPQTIDWTAASS